MLATAVATLMDGDGREHPPSSPNSPLQQQIVKYYHLPLFETKEILFEAVLRHWTERHVAVLESIASVETPSHLVLLKRLLETIHRRLAWRETRLLLKIVLGEGSLFQKQPEPTIKQWSLAAWPQSVR